MSRKLDMTCLLRLSVERVHGITRWENRSSPLDIDDLDHQEVAVTVAEAVRIGRLREPGSREIEPMLNGLQLIKGGQLLHAAVVLFGRSDRMFATYPQCGVRLARFRGVDKREFVDNRQIFGNAFHLYQQAQQFFIEHLPIAGRIEGFYRVDTPKYPPDAFREALVNALCHRDYAEASGSIDVAIYDDRLEVVSTGGLHFGITVAQLKGEHQSRPWNPLVAQAFYMRGIIERWGRGTNRSVEQTLEAGLVEPEMFDSRIAFTVRFTSSRALMPGREPHVLPGIQEEILVVLRDLGSVPLRDIVARLQPHRTRDQVRNGLRALQDRGVIVRIGATNTSRWQLRELG